MELLCTCWFSVQGMKNFQLMSDVGEDRYLLLTAFRVCRLGCLEGADNLYACSSGHHNEIVNGK